MRKKIGDLIKRHKILFVFCVVAFVVFVILFIAFLQMTINTSGRYGDRLDGIKKVEISKSDLKDIATSIKENDEVSDAKVRVQGKIVYIDITFKEGISKDKAKEVSSKVIDEFEDDAKEFYDFSFIIDQEGEESFAMAGAKNSKDSSISWTRS